MDWLTAEPVALRLAAFFVVAALVACWQWRLPRRTPPPDVARRFAANAGLLLADVVALRLLAAVSPVAAAAAAADAGVGLFNVVGAPRWLAILASLLLLDLAVYAQHVASHRLPPLWRLHRVHHTDLHMDVTTAVRFHPAEIALSLVYKAAVVAAIGAPVMAVVAFEIVLNACSLFNHANARLAPVVDRVLRRAVVTPDMHRVHHSVRPEETDSNFGFALSAWDRLFGTYRAQPYDDHAGMLLGLDQASDRSTADVGRLLLLPFRDR